MSRALFLVFLPAAVLSLSACRSRGEPLPELAELACDPAAESGELVINEVVSDNEGVWIDETGATEDYLELFNASERDLNLGDFFVSDSESAHRLPSRQLAPGQHLLLWADKDPEEGELHLDFKLSSQGESLKLRSCDKSIDEVNVPELKENDSYARFPDGRGEFEVCRYASPGRGNGPRCAPPLPAEPDADEVFHAFDWPEPFPTLSQPLALSELALRPASFIEIENTSEESIELDGFSVSIAPIHPGAPLPQEGEGRQVVVPAGTTVSPGAFALLPLVDEDVSELLASPEFEGVVSLFDPEGNAIHRIDFVHYPVGATLARAKRDSARLAFCEQQTPGAENECSILQAREVGNRLRGIRTLSDYAALADGAAHLGTESVKIVVDVKQGGLIHFLGAARWPLHYTFIREVIEEQAPLDRCDPVESQLFNQGWYDFSVAEYFSPAPRNYFLATLVKHGGAALSTLEFARGDEIDSADMSRTFFSVMSRVPAPQDWAIRPQGGEQLERVREIEGEVPLVAENAPFRGLTYQPLTHGVGYGVLTWAEAGNLERESLGSQIVLVTDDVPNDIPLVGGLITEAFQTPLAHVNVLSQNRGTPNMALLSAREDRRISENLGKLVRIEVKGGDFTIEPADLQEAADFWESFEPSGPLKAPRLDLREQALVDLGDAGIEQIPTIGAKAAQMAELYQAARLGPEICMGHLDFEVPEQAFAIPVAHFARHFEESGARALLEELSSQESFQIDALKRATDLRGVQELMLEHPVSAELLADLEAEISGRFAKRRVRLRSSSNAEDLPGFNGAGLYTSMSAQLGDPERTVQDALRVVWASLFNARAYDEREMARVDHSLVAMGVLVHEAFPAEAANGVGVSRNILDPIRGDMMYLNSQAGEASVTNPAPGVSTESLVYQWPPRTPLILEQSPSSLIGGRVLSDEEAISVACALYSVHRHFRPLLDPEQTDAWFAMEIEYKLRYPSRSLVVKQARPHAFGGFEATGDCREIE